MWTWTDVIGNDGMGGMKRDKDALNVRPWRCTCDYASGVVLFTASSSRAYTLAMT